MEQSIVQLDLLGPPRFLRGDQGAVVRRAKSVALLAYLAASRLPQTREHLQVLLWGESSSVAARKNLRNVLWSLHETLGQDVVVASAEHLALHRALRVDLWEFDAAAVRCKDNGATVLPLENLRQVIALYRGTLVEGLLLTEAPDFELWLAAERERLARVQVYLFGALIGMLRSRAGWDEIISVAERALAVDPLHEPTYRTLMEAHAMLGDRARALGWYDTLRTTLERELGVVPLPESDAMRARIVAGTLPAVADATLAGRHEYGSAAPGKTPFMERAADLAILDDELRYVSQGHARVALLTGEAGIGKTRLWCEWSAALPRQSTVLEMLCLEAVQLLPLAPVIDLLAGRAVRQRLLARQCPVAPIWLAEVARLLPDIGLTRPDLPRRADLPPAEEQSRLFEALTQCVSALVAAPLILWVDDLQWADSTTLSWLAFLVRRLRDVPLLLVASYRSGDESPGLARLLATWQHLGVARTVALSRLTSTAGETLFAAAGGSPEDAAEAHALSGGNPYFLIELARAPRGAVPGSLADLVRARLSRLPEAAQDVLHAAAVLEPGGGFAALCEVSGRSEEETLDAVDALTAAAMLIEGDGGYRFTHPLVAAIVRSDLGGARRAVLHRRAAEALSAVTRREHLPVLAGRLTEHYAAARLSSTAAHFADMAAQHALGLAAPTEAAAFFQRALTFEPTPERYMGLGRALVRAGDLPSAQAAYMSALERYEAAGEWIEAARAALGLAEVEAQSCRPEAHVRWAERSLAYLETEQEPEACAYAHLLLGLDRRDRGSLAEAGTHLAHTIRLAAEHRLILLETRGRLELGHVLAERGDVAGALVACETAMGLAQEARDGYWEALASNHASHHALLYGDHGRAHAYVDAGVRVARAQRLDLPSQWLHGTQGEIALAEGRWSEAEEWFRRGQAEAERHGNQELFARYQMNLGRIAYDRGDLDAAAALFEDARTLCASLCAPHLQTQIDLWLAETSLSHGDLEASAAALARVEARLTTGERAGLLAWAARVQHAWAVAFAVDGPPQQTTPLSPSPVSAATNPPAQTISLGTSNGERGTDRGTVRGTDSA